MSPVIAASGLLGYLGEGYWYHKYFKVLLPILFSLRWITFQSKTAVAFVRPGNLKLEKDGITPAEYFPDCIQADLLKGLAVNNVSLSGPGIQKLIDDGRWQEITGELHISVMMIGSTLQERLKEAWYIVDVLMPRLPEFKARKIFLHWNISCPNTGHDAQANFLENFREEYRVLRKLGLPIIVKIAWDFPIPVALELQEMGVYGFDAINTIPFDALPDHVRAKYFPSYVVTQEGKTTIKYVSPLDKYQAQFNNPGRGGVSGDPIREFALAWIRKARKAGIHIPIIGGGGILWPWHVYQFKKAGATAISPGSVAFLRPFNLLFVTLTAKLLFWKH